MSIADMLGTSSDEMLIPDVFTTAEKQRVALARKPVVLPPTPKLKRGDKGLVVRELQSLLRLKEDGKFGRGTERAVKNFQRKHNIAVDGVVGQFTWKSLLDAAVHTPTNWRPTNPLKVMDIKTHDNTMVSTFNRCPRLYQLQYVRHLRPAGHNPALDWGSLFHLGLCKWYESFLVEGMDRDTALRDTLEVMLRADFVEDPTDFRTKERALLMMAEYAEYYGWMERSWGWEVVFAETAFDALDENGLPWGGKIDLVVRWRGDLYVVDHKTTARFGDDYYSSYVPDTQTCGYAKYAGLLHGEPIKGVIMNVIVVHKIKKPAEVQFQRRAFEYPEFFFEEWEDQTIASINEIAEAERTNYFRPRWQSCVNKYGKCPAYYVCRTAPENREQMLREQWIEREWNWRHTESTEVVEAKQ